MPESAQRLGRLVHMWSWMEFEGALRCNLQICNTYKLSRLTSFSAKAGLNAARYPSTPCTPPLRHGHGRQEFFNASNMQRLALTQGSSTGRRPFTKRTLPALHVHDTIPAPGPACKACTLRPPP